MSLIGGAPPIAYRRRASPLHAARGPVAAGYGAALAVSALVTEHPLVLAALLAAVIGAALGAGVARQLARPALLTALPLIALSVLVNLLASRQGLTVFARLGDWGVLGQVNLTVEALVYGLVFALRLVIVALACLLVVCAADPDQLLFAFRRLAPSSALTVSLATRMIPVLGQDARRLAEAQRCRPDGGGKSSATRALALVRASVGGALERALDVAAVLEMRGYGAATERAPRRRRLLRGTALGGPRATPRARARTTPRARARARERPRRSRHDLAFAGSALGLLGVSIVAAVSVSPQFRAYPLLSVRISPVTLALCALLLALALAPFADRRGIAP